MDNSNNIRLVNVNKIPKPFKIMLALLPAIGLILIPIELDNDFYFLYPTGEYIINNGFPTTDFLSMHSTMEIIVQQWLSDIIFYEVYSLLGLVGIVGIIYISYALFALLMFKLCRLITENHFITCCITFLSSILMAAMFFRSRPQIFTFIIMLAELYMLEKFVKSGKLKDLIGIPVLSLLLINLHSSMWAMLFVFMLPYFAGAIKLNFKKLRQDPCCSFPKLLIIAVISFAMGFINPYGTKAMTYIFTSFGYEEISGYISEMAAIQLGNATGYLMFVIIFVFVAIMLLKRGNFSTRFVLLYIGTLVLALGTQKSISYFVIAGFPAMAYYMKDFTFDLKITDNNNPKDKRKRIILIGILIVLIAIACATLLNPNNENGNEDVVIQSSRYTDLDNIVDIIEENEDNDVILYAGFNHGQYLEYKGLHPYIDGRAELFLKDNNNEYDYMKEYVDLKSGDIYYKDFVDKYDFNYLVVDEQNERLMYNSLLNDNDYSVIYDGEQIKLFVKQN